MKYDRTQSPSRTRVVVELDDSMVERIDLWGVPARKPSRAAAIRELLDAGLRAMTAQSTPSEHSQRGRLNDDA